MCRTASFAWLFLVVDMQRVVCAWQSCTQMGQG